MKHKQRSLYLDETGKADKSHPSKTFVLSACSFPKDKETEIRNIANHIIFKYWGSENSYKNKYKIDSIVFHSIDIALKRNEFEIFNNIDIYNNFWKDLYSQILCRQDITYYLAVVDKSIAYNKNRWLKKTILKKTYNSVLKQFCNHLINLKTNGEIIAESSHDQDISLVTTFSSLQRNSNKLFKDPYLVSKTITSLSLVNKHDNSIGSQIADIMSWVGKNKYLIDQKIKRSKDFSKQDLKNIELLNRKIKSNHQRNKYNQFKIYP